jgi:hypothetical protein
MKAMSIIGIILFSLFTLTYLSTDAQIDGAYFEDSYYCGFIGVLFGLAYSITGLVYVKKQKPLKKATDYAIDLQKLGELKEKGLLTDDEFEIKKQQLLR